MTTQALSLLPANYANYMNYLYNLPAPEKGMGGIERSDIFKVRHGVINSPYYWDSAKKSLKEIAANDNGKAIVQAAEHTAAHSVETINYTFTGGTIIDKVISKCFGQEAYTAIKKYDTNLLSSKFVRNSIENISGGEFAEKTAADGTKKFLFNAAEKGAGTTLKSRVGMAAADMAGATTKLGAGLTCLTEVPDLYRAYKNDDLANQAAHSAVKVPTAIGTFALLTHLANAYSPKKIKTLLKVGGAIIGSFYASKTADKVADKVFGKTVQKQKEEAYAKLQELKNTKAA